MSFDDLAIDEDIIRQVQQWRRDIHENPEMAFEEVRTSSLVVTELANFGYEVTTGIAKTGVVAVKKYGEGPSVAIRADMDALPITEQNEVPYASKKKGCMHACGHDGHTAMLLGAAKILADRTDLKGTLHLIFQPAEENEAGARAMIEDGVLERFKFDAIYGLHNMPGVPVGVFLVRPGPILASFDKFEIQVEGVGGHGAAPHQARDAILAASNITTALNAIVSRDVSPTEPAVVTVGHFEALGSYNVIPQSVRLLGSCRSLSPETRTLLKERIKSICDGVMQSHRIDVKLDYVEGYPATINHQAESNFVEGALCELVGRENVISNFPAFMGSEDFAFFLEKMPGCYFVLGNGTSSGPIHSPIYNFNDEASKFGVAAWVKIAEMALLSDQARRNDVS